jgi:hypothetical protein
LHKADSQRKKANPLQHLKMITNQQSNVDVVHLEDENNNGVPDVVSNVKSRKHLPNWIVNVLMAFAVLTS